MVARNRLKGNNLSPVNEISTDFQVDVTDDYYSEMLEVVKKVGNAAAEYWIVFLMF